MMQFMAKAQLKLMKYGVFIGIIGGLTSFIGPAHGGLIKAMIGVVIGCILLGDRFLNVLKEIAEVNQELIDRISDSFKK